VLVEQSSLVRAAHELEPLPITVTRLAQILSHRNWDLKDVEDAIALDQALTPRILRLANSALHSRGHPVATVREAVMRVGTGPVFSLAMALGVQKRFRRPVASHGLGEGEMWVHSVSAALAVEILGVTMRRKLPVESFAAALLHDVGKLVLGRFLEPPHAQVLRSAEEQGQLAARQAEVGLLGIEHGELGAIVAQHWNLPERLVLGVRHHHDPTAAGDVIADVVHVADAVACLVDERRTARPSAIAAEAIEPASRAALKLDDAALESVIEAVDVRLIEVLKRYS